MNELVEKLTKEQEVVVSQRPEPTLETFREALERKYVHVRFPNTRGGTELGIPVDDSGSDLSQADLEAGTGSVHLEGELILDYVRVRFIGDLDVASLDGQGRLEPLGEVEPGEELAAAN